MKSVALTLAVLFASLSIAQAAGDATKTNQKDEIIAVEEVTSQPAGDKTQDSTTPKGQ